MINFQEFHFQPIKNTKNLCVMKILSNWMKLHIFFSGPTPTLLYRYLWLSVKAPVGPWCGHSMSVVFLVEHSPVYYHFNSIFCSASVIGKHVTPGAIGKEQAVSAAFSFLFQTNAQEWCHNAALWIKNCKKSMKLIVYEVLSESWITLISSLSFPQKEW